MLIKGNFDLLPIPRFTNEDEIAGLEPAEALNAVLAGQSRFQVGLSRKFLDLSAFLEAYVKDVLRAGSMFPNLSQNGNFLDGAPETANFLPNEWSGSPADLPTVTYDTPSSSFVPGKAARFGVVGGGNERYLKQGVQTTNGKRLNLSLFYKTASSTEGARITLLESGASKTQTTNLPATGGAWRFYPAGTDNIPALDIGNGSTSPYFYLTIGSVAAPTVTQDLSFAGVTVQEGPVPALWHPSQFDQAKCQKIFVPHTYQTTNSDPTANISVGQVVTPGLTSGVRPANSGVSGKDAASGIALEAASPNGYMRVQDGGLVELADWTAATGAASLTVGAIYYLSDTDGMMTTTAPANPQVVGQAMGTKRLLMQAPPASTGALTQPQILARISLRV